jgi:putative nucleotidyltransferase with HDIG domain
MPDVAKVRSRLLEQVVTTLSDFAVSRAAIIPRLMRLTADSSTTSLELARLMAHDPALTATVLRVANSAYYGRLRGVATLDEAIRVLGFSLMRSLAVAASLNSLLRGHTDKALIKSLWDHSLAVAIGARLTCRKIHPPIAEQAFLAGLMHDLAKLILLIRFPEEYMPVLEEARQGFSIERELERDRLGVTHEHLGAIILGQWNFPPNVIEAVRRHHDPDSAALVPGQPPTEESGHRMAHVICYADALAHSVGYGIRVEERTDLTAHPSADHLGLSPESMSQLSEDLVRHISEERSLYVA